MFQTTNQTVIHETVYQWSSKENILKCCNIVSVDKLRINTQVYWTIIKRWNPTFQPPEKNKSVGAWGMHIATIVQLWLLLFRIDAMDFHIEQMQKVGTMV